MAKKFKALMCDVDGTLVPLARNAKPSLKVIEAINKASKILHVGIATARPYYLVEPIANTLELNGPSIINGGSQIMDMESRKVIWEKFIPEKEVKQICLRIKDLGAKPLVLQDNIDLDFDENKAYPEALQIWVGEIKEDFAEKLVDDLSSFSEVAILKTQSWQKGLVDLLITHALATKQHGIFEAAKILGIDTKEIIGVGDNYNDFPLLMACGLKVAMGNAVPELKEIADFIAPSVDDDGVVEVIERYVL